MKKEDLDSLLENVTKPISKIEVDLKMPINTLQKALSGERGLPKKWAVALKHYVATKQYILSNPSSQIKDLNEQTNGVKNFSKSLPKTNYNIDTTKKEEPKKELTFYQKLLNKKMGIKD